LLGSYAMSGKALTQRLAQRGIESRRTNTGRFYVGVSVRPDAEAPTAKARHWQDDR
jgi:hypothetical protein